MQLYGLLYNNLAVATDVQKTPRPIPVCMFTKIHLAYLKKYIEHIRH